MTRYVLVTKLCNKFVCLSIVHFGKYTKLYKNVAYDNCNYEQQLNTNTCCSQSHHLIAQLFLSLHEKNMEFTIYIYETNY